MAYRNRAMSDSPTCMARLQIQAKAATCQNPSAPGCPGAAPAQICSSATFQKAEKLRVLDITQPRDNVTVLMEGWEQMQVTGEDKIGDEACWVLTADEKLFPRFRAMLAGIPEEFELKTVQVALGRESAIGRAMYFEFGGPQQLETWPRTRL